MTYDQVMEMVRGSTAGEWVQHVDLGISTFRADVNLRIVERRSEGDDDYHNREFHEEWANRHPDPSARRNIFHIFYGASLVHEFLLVSVDGGRALLPLPEPREKKVIRRADYLLARPVDTQDRLDEYIERSGLTVEQ